MKAASVFTHRRVSETATAMRELIAAARRAGVVVRFTPDETEKHALTAGEGIELDSDRIDDVDICIAMGGDGTILTALRHYAGTGVPVFAVNFGEVGFLATVDPDGLGAHFDRAFAGEFETLELPTISVGRPDGSWTAMNDISIHRKPGHRVADLAYGLAGEEIGRVRCDGLVVATPQGSTGYNLANGGPVMAWGVRGYRRLLRGAALADRAGAGGRAGRPADHQQRVARGAGRGARGRPADLRAAARRGPAHRVRRLLRHACPAAGRELLPPLARAFRPAGALSGARARTSALREGREVVGCASWNAMRPRARFEAPWGC